MTVRNRVSIAAVRRTLAAAATCGALFIAGEEVRAEALASADFSTYADGDLVGQNGWQQWRSETTAPLQVSGGQVAWTGGATVNNQDAFLPFPSDIPQPASGSTILTWDTVINVTNPSASNPSYFLALNTNNTSSTSSNFQNARLVAQASEAGYVFGARVNGQSGYPFAYGTQELTIGQDYALRAEINMVAGNANDSINLYVGPDFDNLTLYTTAGYSGSGTVSLSDRGRRLDLEHEHFGGTRTRDDRLGRPGHRRGGLGPAPPASPGKLNRPRSDRTPGGDAASVVIRPLPRSPVSPQEPGFSLPATNGSPRQPAGSPRPPQLGVLEFPASVKPVSQYLGSDSPKRTAAASLTAAEQCEDA